VALTLVPPGQIATVVTSLDMIRAPRPRPLAPSPLRLVRWPSPDPAKYRALFRRIGEPWLWFSRLVMDDAELGRIIGDPAVEIFAVLDRQGIEIGFLEIDFREPNAAEIAYLGFVPELVGKGHGRWLMGHALSLGWRKDVKRLWVHTCTLDHPSALGFYRAQGFTPFARAIETFDDPRLTGILRREAAPQIPLLEPASRR
jgi:GNAT superfamily N-acetyltransferase